MARSPLLDVAIVGVYNTRQARVIDDGDQSTITAEAAMGALADAGLTPRDVDGVVGPEACDLTYHWRNGPNWRSRNMGGIPAVLEAAMAIACGVCDVVVIASGEAGRYTERDSTAPWTRPANEFVQSFGMFTAAEFALIARHHMHKYGTTPEQLATVAATIRNNGHVNPEAVYHGRGPFTPQDILDSRMVADPFHLLDCAMTAEGGCGLVLTSAARAKDLRKPPVWILGSNIDSFGVGYRHPPTFDMGGRQESDLVNGTVGRRAARRAFEMCGLTVNDVDTCEFYDPFSFEIIRQFEAFGFCGEGEGGPFVMDGNIDVGGRFPVTTDGGTMAFSHGGSTVQLLQRVIRGVQQVRGECPTRQVPGAQVSLTTGGGAGALFNEIMLIGANQA